MSEANPAQGPVRAAALAAPPLAYTEARSLGLGVTCRKNEIAPCVSGSNFWLLSPNNRNSNGNANEFNLNSSGNLNNNNVNNSNGVRPALSQIMIMAWG